ncbi:MAG TPA: helix-turn-helix transcriptional regulator [Gemmatimonadales bacterium]|nr:helix-turn-helix transcriptional regulator [Gemmatimonadales bacterium]
MRAPGPLAYREYAPSAALAGAVQCYWTITGCTTGSLVNRVLPDGCADILLDFAAPVTAVGRVDGRRTVAVGTMRRAIVAPLSGGVDLFGIRFHPAGAAPVFGVPLNELTDRAQPLDDLLPGAGAGLEARLADTADVATRIRHTERFLLERLRERRRPHPLVAAAVQLLREQRGGGPVAGLGYTLGIGERQLQRQFHAAVGIAPKQLARVLRLQHAVRLLGQQRPSSWSALALTAGYYDQAHLIREFKALAGVTPRAFAAERQQVGFVQDGERAGA